MEKISILQIVPHRNKGGVESVANCLYRADFDLFNVHYGYFIPDMECDNDGRDGKVYISGFFSLLLFLIKNKIKIVHNHTFSLRRYFIIRLACVLLNIKMITTLHSDFGVFSSSAPLYKKGKRLFVISILNRLSNKMVTDKWVAISKPISDILSGVMNVKDSNFVNINNFVTETTVDINFIENRTYITYVGRDSKEKNINDLIMVWLRIKNIYPNISLQLIGVTKESESLKGIDLVANRIVPLGWLDEPSIIEFSKRSIMQVIPSRYEGFPLSAIDSLEKNIPIVTYDIPIFVFFKKEIGGVYCAEYMNASDLESEIKKLIFHIENGFKIYTKPKVSNCFSKEKFIMDHSNLYMKCMRDSGA